MKAVWILTEEYNDYNQHGEYFICWFPRFPSLEELKSAVEKNTGEHLTDKEAQNILDDKGRVGLAASWFNLEYINSGFD